MWATRRSNAAHSFPSPIGRGCASGGDSRASAREGLRSVLKPLSRLAFARHPVPQAGEGTRGTACGHQLNSPCVVFLVLQTCAIAGIWSAARAPFLFALGKTRGDGAPVDATSRSRLVRRWITPPGTTGVAPKAGARRRPTLHRGDFGRLGTVTDKNRQRARARPDPGGLRRRSSGPRVPNMGAPRSRGDGYPRPPGDWFTKPIRRRRVPPRSDDVS